MGGNIGGIELLCDCSYFPFTKEDILVSRHIVELFLKFQLLFLNRHPFFDQSNFEMGVWFVQFRFNWLNGEPNSLTVFG